MKPIAHSHQRTLAAPGAAPIETPVFSKTYDLLRWLVPATLNFPRAQRFVAAATLQEGAQALLRQLLHAQRSSQPLGPLTAADATLAQLKFNWRLAQDWQLITPGQFEHGLRLMEEVGRLLGAWLKTSRASAAARAAPAPRNPVGETPAS
ncbi:MAG: diversity-generating retroelement protein Avd [Hydrogenophaga sp.]|nr:diversity-generating retroelement protein Avd [Hydrogenophaga sp.]